MRLQSDVDSGPGGRRYGLLDRVVLHVDRALRAAAGMPGGGVRPSPAGAIPEVGLTVLERRRAAGLMRVNHAGEVAAQALYQGQAFTARSRTTGETLRRAAVEENDHLAWCAERLAELDAHPSRLGAVWYAGSFAIGALAGLAGDRWSLGFLAETERQVTRHLEEHLGRLPVGDDRSHAIVRQMRDDEARHATTALEAGARELPAPFKGLMRRAARVMTGTAYWL